ncbi:MULTISPECIES: LCP family protein [Streptomyces]|uniref:LCP family protein n=1 Tax=Streptomyces TaxID=1883 RepID=UPI001D040702|nr:MULTISPECIES: LCP family protein [Streptomyces]
MNDRQQPYGQIYGYDAYGRPLYQPPQDPNGAPADPVAPPAPPAPPAPEHRDGYGGYGYPAEGYGNENAGGGYGNVGYQDQNQGQGYQGQPSYPDQGFPQQGYQDQGYAGADYRGQGYPGQGYPGPETYGGQQPAGYQGWDPYGTDTGGQPPVPPTPGPAGRPVHPDPSSQGYGYPQDTSQDTGPQPPVVEDAAGWDTGQQAPVAGAPSAPPAAAEPRTPTVPAQRRPSPDEGYQTEQFSFVEEQDEESEDVIDWLKFSESRTERREEAKRRGRNRRRLLVVTLVLALLGGVGFLWSTDRLPFLPGGEDDAAAEAGAEARDVIVVHLWPVESEETTTALLVANESAGTGTTLLLPNELSVTPDGGTTTLGQAVADESAGSVREALGALLGAEIKGTWRLNTPSLANLVDLVSGITVTTDVEVPGEGEDEGPLVELGENVPLNGQAAVAYATHRADDEPQAAQLARFGQVMEAVLDRLPATESTAVTAMENLRQIHDPSLSEQELGASLATLAGYAQSDEYTTTPLPVEEDGTISDETADGLVDEVLGGSVSNASPGGAVRFGIRDATGTEGLGEAARITLVNGGMTVIDNRVVAEPAAESSVLYSVPDHRETALDAARTLGLPEEAVTEGDGPGTADVTIVLGQDYGP